MSEQPNDFIEVLIGAGLILLLNFAVSFLIVTIPIIGLVQLLYAIPLSYRFEREQKLERRKGLIIGALLTGLLNGGCWIYLFSV